MTTPTPADQPVLCENYELTFGEDAKSVVLTFDIDDLPSPPYQHVRSLVLNSEAFVATLANGEEADAATQEIHFPVGPEEGEMQKLAKAIQAYPDVYVAALGPDATGEGSEVVFSGKVTVG